MFQREFKLEAKCNPKNTSRHRCTPFENSAEGVPIFFAKGSREKLLGGSLISDFSAFLLTSVLKFALGWGPIFTLTSLYASMFTY
jgi:hypothetical protein